MAKNLKEFLEFYTGNGRHPVTEFEVPPANGVGGEPFIVIRSGRHTLVVSPMTFDDHLSVDCHSFVDGEAATGGVQGMNEGSSTELEYIGTMSHGWPSAALVTVMVGKQKEDPS